MASPPIRYLLLALHVLAHLSPAGGVSPARELSPARGVGIRSAPPFWAWVKSVLKPRRRQPLMSCLCVFDVDRTLTGKQEWGNAKLDDGETLKCPNNKVMDEVKDDAYHGGTLSLSSLGQHISDTMCKDCYRGVVSRGKVSGAGSPMRTEILKALGGKEFTLTETWQELNFKMNQTITSSLVAMSQDGVKHTAVAGIVEWFRTQKRTVVETSPRDTWEYVNGYQVKKTVEREVDVVIPPQSVWFFDDIYENVVSFVGTGFNAQQISCTSRGPKEYDDGKHGHEDGHIGGCGGLPTEVKNTIGVIACYPTHRVSSSVLRSRG